MNDKPICHPEKPESGQQKPRFYFRPIRYEGTLTHKSSRRLRSAFSDKAIKRRERRKAIKQMTYKLRRNGRTCGNCAKCSYDDDGVYRCNREVHWGIGYVVKPENPSCRRYEPAPHDSAKPANQTPETE